MSGRKDEKALTLPKFLGHLCPSKGTFFTLAYGPVTKEKLCVFA